MIPVTAQHSPVGKPVDQPGPDAADSLVEPAELGCSPPAVDWASAWCAAASSGSPGGLPTAMKR